MVQEEGHHLALHEGQLLRQGVAAVPGEHLGLVETLLGNHGSAVVVVVVVAARLVMSARAGFPPLTDGRAGPARLYSGRGGPGHR